MSVTARTTVAVSLSMVVLVLPLAAAAQTAASPEPPAYARAERLAAAVHHDPIGAGALQAELARRAAALAAAARAYGEVVARGPDEWSVAALRRIGDLYFDFAADVESMPPPAALAGDPTVAAAFKQQLRGFSGPMRDRALDSYCECVSLLARIPSTPLAESHAAHARARIVAAAAAPARAP
jgi:hypothetical protein